MITAATMADKPAKAGTRRRKAGGRKTGTVRPMWRRRLSATIPVMTTTERIGNDPLTLRLAGPQDGDALRRLAELDSSRAPAGDVLVAEVGGELRAALSLADRHAVADPFRRTDQLLALLRERADRAPARRSRLRGLRIATAR